MTAPTFNGSFLSTAGWTTGNSPQSCASINRAINDVLVIVALAEDSGVDANDIVPSNETGLTWGAMLQEVTTFNRAWAACWAAVASSAANTTITMTEGSPTPLHWGFRVYHYSNSGGIGVSNKGDAADSAPNVTLTGVAADSSLVVAVADWEAGGATPTWRTADAGTFTQTDNVDDGVNYTAWAGYHANAGAAGNKAVGMTSPTAPDWSLVAVEVLGTASAAASLPARRRQHMGALLQL